MSKGNHSLQFLLLVSLVAVSCNPPGEQQKKWFEHHTVTNDLPEGSSPRFGTPAIADFDNDGDLDFAMSVTRNDVFWFEMKEQYDWEKHRIGEIPTGQLGGGSHDIDKDGWMDIIAGGVWFRNSQDPVSTEFFRYEYDTAIDREIHDLVFADINGDQDEDLVVLGDKEGCFWYDIPDNPNQDVAWEKHVITMEVLDEKADIHGGFFPGGIGDLDGDGDNDIVLVGRWYRNEDNGESWSRQFLPFGSAGYWGLSGRSWILDMDEDGDNDIVMIGCDQVDSRCAWLENEGQENPAFTVHLLPLTAPGRRGSFHSLWVGDFDKDGDHDIFTLEQEDSKILPSGATMRAFVWENVDGVGSEFTEHVVLDKNLGGHDVKFGDADGDGDLDAYFKIWRTLSTNSYGGKPHIDFLENLAN